jgi:hypothetical protein
MTKWQIDTRRGLAFGVALMVLIAAVDVGLILLAAGRPIRIGTFVIGLAVLLSLGLLSLLGYWMYGLAHAAYLLDRNMVVIQWGPMEQMIPTGSITRVVAGRELKGRYHFAGGMWPGYCIGYGDAPQLGPVLFYATQPPRRQLYIVTDEISYGISPANLDGFVSALAKRLEMGPTQTVEQSSRRPAFLSWPIWQDRLGLAMLAVSTLLLLGLIGVLSYLFLTLPWLVPMHFDVAGKVDRLGPRGQVFLIPLIGLLTLLVNSTAGVLVHPRERMASHLLWGGTVVVQILVWLAALGILRQAV